jgi:hypothetical protein
MEKLGMDHIEVKALRREALVAHFLGLMASLDADAIKADACTTSTFKANFVEFTKRVAEMHSSLLSCRQGASLLKGCYFKCAKEATNASRGVALNIRQTLKTNPLQPQGFPSTAASWFGESVMGISVEGEASTVGVKGAHSVDGNTTVSWSDFTVWRAGLKDPVISATKPTLTSKCTTSNRYLKALDEDLTRCLAQIPTALTKSDKQHSELKFRILC